jgi:hypothetical protein
VRGASKEEEDEVDEVAAPDEAEAEEEEEAEEKNEEELTVLLGEPGIGLPVIAATLLVIALRADHGDDTAGAGGGAIFAALGVLGALCAPPATAPPTAVSPSPPPIPGSAGISRRKRSVCTLELVLIPLLHCSNRRRPSTPSSFTSWRRGGIQMQKVADSSQ